MQRAGDTHGGGHCGRTSLVFTEIWSPLCVYRAVPCSYIQLIKPTKHYLVFIVYLSFSCVMYAVDADSAWVACEVATAISRDLVGKAERWKLLAK